MSEKSKDISYDHVLKYTGLFGGVQGLNMLIGIVRTKLVAWLLGPEGIALINIFNNVMKLVNESTTFGVSFSAVKHIAEIADTKPEELTRYVSVVRTWSLATGLLGMLLTLLLAPLISYLTFTNYDYTFSFFVLAPIALFLALNGGEMAVLKGVKQLKAVAVISSLSAISILVVCVPIYVWLGIKGVAISLMLSTAAVLSIQLYFSTKIFPWKTSLFSKGSYLEGLPMLKLGIGYIIAGIFGQGAEYVIRAMIIRLGDLADVGLYNSGYVMAVTYAGVVFVAMEADYFPRLSAAKVSRVRQNFTVNQQIEVCVLLIAPCLILFVTAMPIIVPLLFSDKFVGAIPMAICATLYMFFKALTLPVAYLPLAHGDSKVYMALELIYDVVIALLIPFAFSKLGLLGCGIALSLAGLFDMVVVHIAYHKLYEFSFGTRLLRFYIYQLCLLLMTVWASLQDDAAVHWGLDALAFAVSAVLSLRILGRETNIISKVREHLHI